MSGRCTYNVNNPFKAKISSLPVNSETGHCWKKLLSAYGQVESNSANVGAALANFIGAGSSDGGTGGLDQVGAILAGRLTTAERD